jgi:hypothetical protein
MPLSIIPELASQQGRKDDEPNKILGRKLVETGDLAGIQEVAANLIHSERVIRVDCLGVLEQVGELDPELISEYGEDFLELALSGDNRLVWQSLINLAKIADRRAQLVMDHLPELFHLVQSGSVITRDNGIKVLARAGSVQLDFSGRVFPFLLEQLKTCPPKSLPQYAESLLASVNAGNKDEYLSLLQDRLGELTSAQQRRVLKIIRVFS